MKINLVQLKDQIPGGRLAIVSAVAGRMEVLLQGRDLTMSIGRSYSIELDLADHLIVNETVWSTDERAFRLETKHGTTTLVGKIEAIDPDDVVWFRLGTDCLTLIEIEPMRFGVEQWLKIVVPSAKLKAYSY